MKEWKIIWVMCPTNFNPQRIAIVEAESAKDAGILFIDAMNRKGIPPSEYSQSVAVEYIKPDVKGRIVTI